MIDLKDPSSQEAIDLLKEMGKCGEVILKLLEKAKQEKKELKVEGFGTQELTVVYDGDPIHFYLKVSTDQGDEPIKNSHYVLNLTDYKKPWIRTIVSQAPDTGWLEIAPLSFAQFCRAVTGKTVDLPELEKLYPNLNASAMIRVIGAETQNLNPYFNYRAAPGRGLFKMIFKDKTMENKFLNDDLEFVRTFGTMVNTIITAIHDKLSGLNEALNERKAG